MLWRILRLSIRTNAKRMWNFVIGSLKCFMFGSCQVSFKQWWFCLEQEVGLNGLLTSLPALYFCDYCTVDSFSSPSLPDMHAEEKEERRFALQGSVFWSSRWRNKYPFKPSGWLRGQNERAYIGLASAACSVILSDLCSGGERGVSAGDFTCVMVRCWDGVAVSALWGKQWLQQCRPG